MNFELSNGQVVEDEQMSEMLESLIAMRPEQNFNYTWDDIGTATLMADIYKDFIRYCPQNDTWYIWDGCWRKQGENGEISDRLQTLLNLLILYCNEIKARQEADGEDTEIIEDYTKYVRSIRKFTAMRNIMEVLKTRVRMHLYEMNNNPYLLNTPRAAYDLKTGELVEDITPFNVTTKTTCSFPTLLTPVCHRWEQYIDEIMSHDKEKAAFLQRALGYSLLGVNREECMFIAYGAKTRNGKGTLFSTIVTVLGQDYADSAATDLICESKTGKITDFNAPQPALAKIVGARFVTMAESPKDVRLAAAPVKSMTGRDLLQTRDLFEKSFSFVPQFTMWLNTNHLPAVTDDTVFSSNRIWVIEFNEHFDENTQDKDLKELFSMPENRPTILKWLYDGCRDYIEHGLNPPDCVRTATANYRKFHDRIGNFIDEYLVKDDSKKVLRSVLYSAYRTWCCKEENRYKPLGSSTFYSEIEVRGFPAHRYADGWYILGLEIKNPEENTGRIKLP